MILNFQYKMTENRILSCIYLEMLITTNMCIVILEKKNQNDLCFTHNLLYPLTPVI